MEAIPLLDRADKWRFIAEMIGIAAVVASLIAVVIELRQTQSAIDANTYQSRASDAVTFNTALMESQLVTPILQMVTADPSTIDTLTDEERFRLRIFFTSVRIDADNEYYQYQQGFLDDEYFENAFKPRIIRSARMWRAFGVDEPRPSFRDFVDEQLSASRDRDEPDRTR